MSYKNAVGLTLLTNTFNSPSMSILIEGLRLNIRKLKPDGEDGFEGLMAAVLSDLTKRSFALASAGSQSGKDGQSALDGGVIVFEAKRYDDKVPKDKIYTKILEISTDKSCKTELYIVAATGPISAQHLTTMQEASQRFAIALITLAWPETSLADLATVVAMTPDLSAKFIAEHTSVSEAELLTQLLAVRAHSQFQARSEELLGILRQPSIAPAFALTNNVAWLSEAFSDKKRARVVFGQALSPSDTSISITVDRTDIRARVTNTIFAKPDGAVTAIVGADGNGKSWIFAQAWSHESNPPLTIIIVPEDIVAPPSLEYCQDLLISKLLTQTNEIPRFEAKERWLRHFDRWQNNPDFCRPRLVVFMDGINQRETVDWLRFLDTMSTLVAQLGGRLVFSCRQLFYCDNLEAKLVSRVVTIKVPEWTDQELEKLLNELGSSIKVLDAGIVRSLRNPRIFGVAAALFNTEEITEFGELSVSRLLFEHIRSGSAVSSTIVSPKQFAADICTHAESIVERLKKNQNDGFNEFDIATLVTAGRLSQTISEQFVITSAGRFFEVFAENPNKYLLKDEGLPLALGLALVRTAKEALRRKKSVVEALSNILDPIAALDRTSDILLGAILSAVLEGVPKEIVTPLVHSFVILQNLDPARRLEFRNLFSRAPSAFLSALEDAALSRSTVSNLSWLTDTANQLHGNENFETALTTAVHRWLNMYSLAPERMVMVSVDSAHAAERQRALAEREHELSDTMRLMSETERGLLSNMIEENRGDYSQLSFLAFQALAGRPLAPFAQSFRNWCFAASLNGGYHTHQDDFSDLLHLNQIDWVVTRDALKDAANILRQIGISRTGKWALVRVLRATADSEDAKEADRIAEELTKDREHIGGWRRIEDYCSTDPCDPASEAPDNIEMTASAYRAINPAELRSERSRTHDDHLFGMAQPGLARFRPEVAIEILRAFADQAVTRVQPEFRLAAFLLENQSVGLEERIASSYVEKAREIAQSALDTNEDKNNEAWVAAQYALSVAFPHMTGDAQFDALINHPEDKTILMNLCFLFQPIDEIKLEAALDRAINENHPVSQFRILSFAEYSCTPLTSRAKELVLVLLTSMTSHVRLSALGLIQKKVDPFLLRGLVKSGWSALLLDAATDKVEILNGSEALVLAAEIGAITLESCLDRITISAYESLIGRLGSEAVIAIADRLNTAIQRSAAFQVTGNLPNIEQSIEGRYKSVVLDISEKRSQVTDQEEQFRRFAETSDAWIERQKQNRNAANDFERELTKAGAQLIIQSIAVELVIAIDKELPAIVDSWATFFLTLENKLLNNVHNIASVVAETISNRNTTMSVALFQKLRSSSPHVRATFGRNKIDLKAITAWGAADNNEMKEIRFARLDRIDNDHDLAMEVLAANWVERLDILRDYVVDRRQRPEPAHRARAAMVAGLSPDQPWAIETIDMLKDEHGFLQCVYEGAKYAMERHQWSLHWAAKMRSATDPVDFWRYSVLLSKIVDGRLEWSEIEGDMSNILVKRFGSTLHNPIRNRIRRWEKKRNSQLFGIKSPNKIFLPPY